MTSQREVINAFFDGENEPHRASNFHMDVAPDGYTAYLVGDNRAVYGKREPMRQFEVHGGTIPFGFGMPTTRESEFYHITRTAINSQARRVRRLTPVHEFEDGAGSLDLSPRRPLMVTEIDEDFGIFAEVDYESE